MIEFFVPGQPRPRGSKTAVPIYKNGKPIEKNGRIVLRYIDAAKGSGGWMRCVEQAAEQFRQSPLWDGAITMVLIHCYVLPVSYRSKAKGKHGQPLPSAPAHKTTSPDVLKLGRAVEDALKGVIYTDDARIVSHHSIKTWSQYEGVLVRLWPDAPVLDVTAEIERCLTQEEEAKPF